MIVPIEQVKPKKKGVAKKMVSFFKKQFVSYQYPIKEINQRALWIDTNTKTNLGAMTKASVNSVLHCPPPPYPKSVGLAAMTTKEEPPMHSQFSDETLKY